MPSATAAYATIDVLMATYRGCCYLANIVLPVQPSDVAACIMAAYAIMAA